MEEAENALNNEIEKIKLQEVTSDELQKVKNKIESTIEFSEINVLDKAMNLAYNELLGNADLINQEIANYNKVTKNDIQRVGHKIFNNNNCSTLYYNAN